MRPTSFTVLVALAIACSPATETPSQAETFDQFVERTQCTDEWLGLFEKKLSKVLWGCACDGMSEHSDLSKGDALTAAMTDCLDYIPDARTSEGQLILREDMASAQTRYEARH